MPKVAYLRAPERSLASRPLGLPDDWVVISVPEGASAFKAFEAWDALEATAIVLHGLQFAGALPLCAARGAVSVLILDASDAAALRDAAWTSEAHSAARVADLVLSIRSDQSAEAELGAAVADEATAFERARDCCAQALRQARPSAPRPGLHPEVAAAWKRLAARRAALADGDRGLELAAIRAGLPRAARRPALSPPKVLAISHELSRTGAPLALLAALRALQADRPTWQIEVLGLGHGPLEEEFQRAFGAAFRRVDYVEGESYRTLEAIEAVDPDVVLLNSTVLYGLTLLLGYAGWPCLLWSHEGLNVASRDGHLFHLESLERVMRTAFCSAPRLATSATDTQRELEVLEPELGGRIAYVPYGFDVDAMLELRAQRADLRQQLRSERGATDRDLVFLCVGSLVERKNQLGLVTAFQDWLDADREAPSAQLWIVGALDPEGRGASSYGERVRKAIRPEHTARIHILGPRSSAWPDMLAADVHVLLSTNECSPLVNIESMLLGTLVMSSALHGIPEVLGHGTRGVLVDPRDGSALVQAFGDLSRRLVAQDPALQDMRDAAMDYARCAHGLRATSAALGCALDDLLATMAVLGAERPCVGSAARERFGFELTRLWIIAKRDAPSEVLQMQHAIHRSVPVALQPPLVVRLLQRWRRKLKARLRGLVTRWSAGSGSRG